MYSLIVTYKNSSITSNNASAHVHAQESKLISRKMLPAYTRGFGLPGKLN